MSPWQNALVVSVILFVGVTSLVMTRRHYDLVYHQGFDQIAVRMQEDKNRFGDDIQFATRTEIGEAAEFYQRQTDVGNRIVFNRYSNLGEFHDWLTQHSDTPMLGFGWTDYVNPVWEVTAVGNYPYVVRQNDWFTSRYLTLSKLDIEGSECALTALDKTPCAYVVGQEWGRASSFSCDSLPDDIEALGIVARFQNESEINNVMLVIELRDAATDTVVLWHSSQAEEGRFAAGNNVVVDAIIFGEDLSPKGKTIKTYLWNQGKKPLVMSEMSYYVTHRSRALTGLYDPLN